MRQHGKKITSKYHEKENLAYKVKGIKQGKKLIRPSVLFLPLFLLLYGLKVNIDWSLIQWTIALIIAIDIRSSVFTNFLSYKIFKHIPIKQKNHTIKTNNRTLFTRLQIHPIIVGILYSQSVIWGVLWYFLLNVSVWFVGRLPQYLSRSISIAIIIIAILINLFIINPPTLFVWLIPMLFIKNVYSLATRKYSAETCTI